MTTRRSLRQLIPLQILRRSVALAAFALLVCAQGALALAPSSIPDRGIVTDGNVNALARSGDTLYLAGSFLNAGPATGPGVLLSQDNAAQSPSFPAVSGGFAAPAVSAVLADGSGGWWIAGSFDAVGGTLHPNLAHVLADGSVSTATPAPDGQVRALALSPDGGTLYIGGDFTQVGGQAQARAAAITTADETLDTAWAPAIGNGAVYALAADATRVYLGGTFTGVGGANGNELVALSVTDGGVLWQGNANGTVTALALDSSRVYVGGNFTTVLGGTTAQRLAALTVTGSFDWDGGVTTAGAEVDSLLLSGSSLFAGGYFTAAGGTIGSGVGAARDYVAKLAAATGVVDGAWNPGSDGMVIALGLSGSTLYVGGAFSTFGGQPRENLAAVDMGTAAVDPNWTTAKPDNPVSALAVAGGSVYVGGTFSSFGMVSRTNLAAIDLATGQLTGWAPTTDTDVYALLATPTTVYLGGAFTQINGATHDFVGAVNASDGEDVAGWNTNADSYVNALALSGSTLFLGGLFGNINGTPAQQLAAVGASDGVLNTDWAGAVTFGNGVNALDVSPDGSALYVGGNFFELDNVTRNYAGAVATSDGSLLPFDPNADEIFLAIEAQADAVYAGGDFASAGGQPRRYIAALDPVTGAATSWNPDADNDVHGIAIIGSHVYLGGAFQQVGGQNRNKVAAVDLASGALEAFDPAPGDDVQAVLGSPDGTLAIGGWFKSMVAGPQGRVAVFSAPPASATAPKLSASGTVAPGDTLSCDTGTWSGSTPQTSARQWLADGSTIAGATGASYTTTNANAGQAISCRVTTTNRVASTAATTSAVQVSALPVTAIGTIPSPAAPPVTDPPVTNPPLPPPELGKSINVYVVKDPVFYKLPRLGRRAKFQRLIKQAHLPNGTVLDTRRGRVRVEIDNGSGGVDSAEFYEGVFEVNQRPKLHGLADLFLDGGGFKGCPKAPKDPHLQVAKKKPSPHRSVRHLWGDGSGKFRTVGRFASATIRGTQWLTDDRCDGTLVRVKKGKVAVRDFQKRKTVVVSAPKKYFAAARKRR